MTCRTIVATLAFLFLSFTASAQTLTFPALTGRVVDEAGLLDASDRAALTDALAGLEAKTTDQFVVVTLKSLQGTSIEDYGYRLGRAWQIGQKGKDNGVLLIVAPVERKVRIEVGYGLEGTLTDALTKIIIEDAILPRFRTGDFTGGIKLGAADIIQTLGGDAAGSAGNALNVVPDADDAHDGQPVWPLVVVAVAAVGLFLLCAVTRGGGLCRGIMQLLFMMLLFGRGGGSSRGNSGFSGRGGSFGGGGSSGSW